MELLISELGHLCAYFLAVVGIYIFGRRYFSRENVVVGLLTGFLVDIDHLVDYFLKYGFTFNLRQFLGGDQFEQALHVYVPLHSWELAAALLIWWYALKNKQRYSWLLFLAVGLFAHLTFDVFSNHFPWQSYLLVKRIAFGFSADVFNYH